MNTRKVFLFSGGFDSVAAAQTLLSTDFDNKVHLLHVYYEGNAMTYPQFQVAKHYTRISPNWELFTLRSSRKSPTDALDVCLEAIKYFGSGALAISDDAEELELIVAYKDDDVGTNLEQLRQAVEKVREAFMIMGVPILPVRITSPIVGKSRRNLQDTKVLTNPFWSCRNPNIEQRLLYKPCGDCFVCKEFEKAGLKHPDMWLNESDHLIRH